MVKYVSNWCCYWYCFKDREKEMKYSDEWWKEVDLLNRSFPFGWWK